MELTTSISVQAFDEFTSILSKRVDNFGKGEGPFSLSEDTICLYLALAYVKIGVEGHLIEMEVSHPLLQRLNGPELKVDICIRDPRRCVWIEVKFDRRSRANSILNVTNRFGSLVNDIVRVGLIENASAFVAYITDNAMDEYLRNNQSQFVAGTPFTIDERFLSPLPESAAKRVNQDIRRRIPERGFCVSLLRMKPVKMLSCYVFKVSGVPAPAPAGLLVE